MKKILLIISVAVLLVLFLKVFVFAFEATWQDISGANLNLKALLVNPDNPRLIYIGSDKGVFKSEDAGASWRNVLSIRGKNKVMNFISSGPLAGDSLYAASGNGLFYSPNQGKNWYRIFKGKSSLESECTVLAVLRGEIYLGTKDGLFTSKDSGRSWYKQAGRLGSSHILSIAASGKDPQYAYVVCPDGVYRTNNNGESWVKIFTAHQVENNNEPESEPEERDEEGRGPNVKYVSVDPNNTNEIYIATLTGVYKSRDRGESWEALTSYGLLSRNVNFLLVSSKSFIYAVTRSGVFDYQAERWRELSLGLRADEISGLSPDNKGNLYAACNTGLYKVNIRDEVDSKNASQIILYAKNEPDISQVHKAAIRYSEVEPEKIMLWRKQAAKKALLPKISLGVGRNVTDLWHWETGSSTKNGDDNLTRGRDAIEWNTTLSWDLGEIIWNPDQTSIDVRSKLMVELRDDILDEVTKLYFERLRVKAELDNLSIEDRKRRFEKEVRMQELAASLDGLTGGYFSQSLRK